MTLGNAVAALGVWALVVIFVVVALESSAFLGLVIPGESAVLLTGALASAGILNLWSCYVVVIAAATLGDIAGYLLGRYYGDVLLSRIDIARRHFVKHQALLESYFERWGPTTVIIGRFVAVGRALAPFTAGLSKMKPGRFLPMALIGGVLWGGGLVSLGYLFGENWPAIEHWMARIGGGMIALIALTLAMLMMWRWLIRRETGLEHAWDSILASRLVSRARAAAARLGVFLQERFSPTSYLGIHLSLGLLTVALLATTFGVIVHAIFAQSPMVQIDQDVAFLIDQLRGPPLDSLMVALVWLSRMPWLLWMTIVVELALAISGRLIAVVALALSLGGAYALAFALRIIFSGLQPHVPAERVVHGFAGFPNVGIAGATAAYAMICFLGLLSSRSWRWRTLEVVALTYLLILMGLGVLYHGAPLSSLLASYALGGLWATICATGFQVLRRWEAQSRTAVAAPDTRAASTE
ncbi:MAG TPA: VTT domain-containing protein [Candidatus Binataceae bacterium]|nr:VTT domain-containing protein [Candidatus Binataceae bacterium]